LHRRHAHAAPAVVCGGTLTTRQFIRWLETLDTPKKQRTNSRRNYEATQTVSSVSMDQKRVFHMPDPHSLAGHKHANHVEPVDLPRPPMPVNPGEGRPDQL